MSFRMPMMLLVLLFGLSTLDARRVGLETQVKLSVETSGGHDAHMVVEKVEKSSEADAPVLLEESSQTDAVQLASEDEIAVAAEQTAKVKEEKELDDMDDW
eukprot:gnl/TRDRNA2_/TRDRNA2_178797_c0_seq1.p2 gnl/TRDRNA2_/TRDRNA2_178797_c0~~gnl/TRDRNA2_/TRDRNA2_178797_c0_seq1.p2  ORF type:complete len:101 (-),score=33.73 gnl/TRDRNA2_/TRDRNA2_178797_c0_seq1:177-479(-)